jgi:hypothetical protein
MIDHLLHFYKKGTPPFRSLSPLSRAEALRIMQALYMPGAVFWERFEDPTDYLKIRRRVEKWLYRDFIAKGGEPKEQYPVYMILGRSKWLRTQVDATTLATTTEIHIPLAIFRECDLSFTFPDSMVSWMLANEKEPTYYLPEVHGKVFTLSEIRAIEAARGLPGESWGTNLPISLACYVEAQVWNQAPLQAYREKLQANEGQGNLV